MCSPSMKTPKGHIRERISLEYRQRVHLNDRLSMLKLPFMVVTLAICMVHRRVAACETRQIQIGDPARTTRL